MRACAGSVETPARLANRNGLTGRKVLSFEGHIWSRGAGRRLDVVDGFRSLRQGVRQTPHRLGEYGVCRILLAERGKFDAPR
jgi:hypothetical protein